MTDNLCGKCEKLPGGGFKLSSTNGLRFGGASFDDNQIGLGSYQARNICMLAKYGNKVKSLIPSSLPNIFYAIARAAAFLVLDSLFSLAHLGPGFRSNFLSSDLFLHVLN